jgi:demethylmenaquinone methyltransferase / 2-methoxy-6-polyprenyl-1,4-benzoquinol methylase
MTSTNVRDGSGSMFDRIATKYDFLNRIISLGMDQRWRRELVRTLNCMDGAQEILDVATGTADVALAISKMIKESTIVGLDPSKEMLAVGRQKVEEQGLAERISLIEGDAQGMPFEDDRFSASCISFGIRNVPDRKKGIAEMRRVTKPSGRVVVLELAEPRKGLLAPFARFHIHHVVPRLGAWLSGDQEYHYLQKSIAAFPPAEEFAQVMTDVGLRDVGYVSMNFGTVTLYHGTV